MSFALVIHSSSLKFGRQHRCSLRLPFNVPLTSLGLSDEPKEHLHEDANTYQWPTLLGNFVLNCSLTKSIIKQICQFFFLKKRTRTVYANLFNTSSALPFPNSYHCYTSQTVTRMVKTCFILHSSINLNIIKANLANCTKININFVILKYSFLVFYKKDF